MIVFDLIAYGFAALIVFTFVGMILSFVIHQVEFLKRAWLQPERVTLRSLASPWTRRVLDGSALRPFQEALRLCQRDPALAPSGYRRLVAEFDKLAAELKTHEPNPQVRRALQRERAAPVGLCPKTGCPHRGGKNAGGLSWESGAYTFWVGWHAERLGSKPHSGGWIGCSLMSGMMTVRRSRRS